MKRHFAFFRALAITSLVLALPCMLAAGNSTTRTLFMDFFNPTADEQAGIGCPNQPNEMTPGFFGDGSFDSVATGPTSAWSMAPWTTISGLGSSRYVDGSECVYSGSCLSVQMSKNLSTLTIDTTHSKDGTTGQPRALTLKFLPCEGGCNYPDGPTNLFANQLTGMKTPGLLSIFLPSPLPNMAVCSSTACPESEAAFARFWFADPNGDPNLQYRLDWSYLRVLRVAQGTTNSPSTWYAVADSCDGSQIVTLYRLANNHKSQTISRLGSYHMPFFISANQ